jgi:hypothetical protein
MHMAHVHVASQASQEGCVCRPALTCIYAALLRRMVRSVVLRVGVRVADPHPRLPGPAGPEAKAKRFVIC